MRKHKLPLSRRNLLVSALQSVGLLFLSGCDKVFDGLHDNKAFLSLLETAEGANKVVQRLLTRRHKLAQEFTVKDISRYFKPNGNPPPATLEYRTNAAKQWNTWRLEVTGLVKQPARFSLEDLKSMTARTQITRHDCVEGWSAIAKWKGVPLGQIIEHVQAEPHAKYVVFHCMDTDSNGNHYYESIDFEDATHPQTILAYEMNDKPLLVEHGAPLRLRVETQLGYKHAKYIRSLEFVADYKKIAQGKGGYWEDRGYEWYAGI